MNIKECSWPALNPMGPQSQVHISTSSHVGILLIKGICTRSHYVFAGKIWMLTIKTFIKIVKIAENNLNTSFHTDLDPVDVCTYLWIFLISWKWWSKQNFRFLESKYLWHLQNAQCCIVLEWNDVEQYIWSRILPLLKVKHIWCLSFSWE